jgi:hypothetical protein
MFGNSSPFPLADRFLESFQPKGRRHDFLKARASRNRSFEVHDFNRSVTADITNNWTVAASSTGTTWAMLAEPGGWIRGVTGASVATASLQLYAPNKMWNGVAGCGFASLIRLSAITDIRLEQGFADVLPANATTVINLASGAFQSVVTGAVYLYDHVTSSASITTTGLYTVGTSVAYSAVATTTNRYASGVTLFVAMEIIGTTVTLWVGDGSQPLASKTAAISTADAFVPFIAVKTLGASKNVDVDTLWTWTNGRV